MLIKTETEKLMIKLLFLAAVLCFGVSAHAEIKTQTVEYKDGDKTLKGYLAYDDAITAKRPGVLVVPEWWGMNDYVKSRTEQLAKLGYVAFAADIYGDGFTTGDPKVAGEKATEAKKNGWLRSRGKLALEQLKKDEHVDTSNVAGIGYCFGGSTVLEMARAGDDLKGVVAFHGVLTTDQPAQSGAVKAKVLALNGAADPFVPPEQISAFEKEMKDAGVDVKIVNYPGAKHAFTNPNADKIGMAALGYNKEADEKSWEAMKAFFAEIFGPANPAANQKGQ
jgi:dienelactone hydrolase